jgi:uncharacterized phiE125 gp8 family phage protein
MLTVTRSPEHLCISLQQIKAHLRLDHPDDDEYVMHLLKVATTWVEDQIESPLLATTFLWTLAEVKGVKGGALRLPKQAILEIERVTGIDRQGHRHPVAYQFCDQDGRILLSSGMSYKGMEIEFSAGYGERTDSVPEPLRQAVINHVACHYECRTGIDRKDYVSLMHLIQPYRRWGVS